MKKVSLWGKSIISYSILYLLPMMILMSLIVFITNDRYKSKIEEVNSQSISSLSDEMDELYDAMDRILYDWEQHQTVLIPDVDNIDYMLFRQGDTFRNYRMSQKYFTDIGIYHQDLPYMVASSGSYSLRLFDTLNTVNVPLPELENLFTDGRRHRIMVEDQFGKNQLMFVLPVTKNNMPGKGCLYIILDYNGLAESMTSYEENAAISLLIDNGQVLISSDRDSFPSGMYVPYTDQKSKMSIKGTDYTFFSSASVFMKTTSVVLHKDSILYQELREARMLSVVVLVICITVGAVIIYVCMRFNYLPIKELCDYCDGLRVSKKNDADKKKKGTYLSSIEQTINELDTTIRNNAPLVNKQKLIDVLREKDVSEDVLKWFEERFRMDGTRSIAILNISTDASLQELNDTLDIIKSQIPSEVITYMFDNRLQHVKTMIVSLDASYRPILNHIVEMLIYEFEQPGITIGVSDFYEKSSLLSKAYAEAMSALNYRYIYGNNSVIFYSSIEDKNDSYSEKIEELTEEFIKSIKNDDIIGMKEYPKKITDCMQDGNVSLFQAKKVSNQIVDEVVKICVANGIDYRKYIPVDESLSQIQSYRTVSDILHIINSILNELIENIEDKNEGKYADKVGAIQDFIRENSSDPNLSIDMISERFDISYSHLCKMFKRYCSITILNFINDCRLEHAMKLLSDTDMQVQDIALAVGYQNSVSFNRMFKKWTKLSPLQYRDRSSRSKD